MTVQLAPEAPGAPVTVAATGFRLAARRFSHNTLAVIGLVVIVVIVLFCFVGPFLSPTDQTHTLLEQANQRPSGSHWLGTDAVGHDVLGRLMYGGKVSLLVGIAAGVLATVVGTLVADVAQSLIDPRVKADRA